MTRLTALALGLLICACNGRDRGAVDDATESAQANADTALTGAAGAAEGAMNAADSALGGDASTASGTAADTAAAGADATPLRPGMATEAPAEGARFDLSGLSSDQVKELQTALNDTGCNAGPVDGIVGARTQQGVACGLQENGIQGQDLNALYRALNLSFGG